MNYELTLISACIECKSCDIVPQCPIRAPFSNKKSDDTVLSPYITLSHFRMPKVKNWEETDDYSSLLTGMQMLSNIIRESLKTTL